MPMKPTRRRRYKAHGQKQRLLGNRAGGWRYAWQVVTDPGTEDNSNERDFAKYTWFTDKWSHAGREEAATPPLTITFDFTPVPRGNRLRIRFVGYYTGNHASPHKPRLEIYDYNGTSWVALTGGELALTNTADEIIEVEAAADGDWWEHATDPSNVRVRVFHPSVAGNTTHQICVNELSLMQLPVSTTTTTTSTTSTTTTV